MTAVKTVVTGFSSFVVGFFVWYGLYFLLMLPMGGSLESSREKMAFKIGYFVIAVAGAVFAVGLGWFLASRWRLPSLWVVLVVLIFTGLVLYPMAFVTSNTNDCAYNLQWPIDYDFCD
jgi:hypothetical protein